MIHEKTTSVMIQPASSSGCERIAIIGPGAMGRLLAAHIHGAGMETCLIDYRPERADKLNRSGIKIIRRHEREELVSSPVVTAAPEQAGIMDWIIVMVKAYHTGSVLEAVRAMSDDDTMILSLQNGIGQEDILEDAAVSDRLTMGVTAHGAALHDNVVIHSGSGLTVIGPYLHGCQNGIERCNQLAVTLNRAGWETVVVDDIAPFRWKKLVANCAINALTALCKVKNGELTRDCMLQEAMFKAAEEAWKTACAIGVEMDGSLEDILEFVKDICVRTAENRSSMLQDIIYGRQTEVDFINGTIVKQAALSGVDVPVNLVLTAIVKRITQ